MLESGLTSSNNQISPMLESGLTSSPMLESGLTSSNRTIVFVCFFSVRGPTDQTATMHFITKDLLYVYSFH